MTNAEILGDLADYYRFEIRPGVSRLYLRGLADIPSDLLEEATAMWVAEGKQFMPKVVELRDYAERARNKRVQASPELMYWRAQAAYNAVLSGELPEEILNDRRYRRYFPKVANSYEELSESGKAFWDQIIAEPVEIVVDALA